MPGASAHPQPCVRNEKAHKRSHHGHTGNARHSPRDGFNGLLRALSGDRAFLSPSPADHPADLMPASRHQDHTTSPSAPVSTKAARRSWYQSRRSFSEGGSASFVLRHCRVHRIPHPTFVTIAKRPSWWVRDARRSARDLPDVASDSTCGIVARRANQLRRGKSCQVNSNCWLVIASATRRVPDAMQRATLLR
jgi:hypothetical protein